MNNPKKMIIFIGSNPSVSAISTTPFHNSTQSGSILQSWINNIKISNYCFLNVRDDITPHNRPLKKSEIKNNITKLQSKLDQFREYDTCIIALGNTAANALKLLDLKFFHAQHPSGLNRKLNDKQYVFNMLNDMKKFIESSNE